MKKIRLWVVLDPKKRIVANTFYSHRISSQCAANFQLYNCDQTWKELYKRGYRCVRANVEIQLP